jgi:preprotein translocase subunit YajC
LVADLAAVRSDLRHHVFFDPAPAAKRAKEHQELVKNLRRGDTVITSGGLVGKVTKVVDDDQIEVEIADGVRVRQVRAMVSGVRAKGEPVKDEGSSS